MTVRSPLAPLKKGGNGFKVPLLKGDLGGSTRSKLITSNLGYTVLMGIVGASLPHKLSCLAISLLENPPLED
ncbi:MAG TPA: hypothetical protein DEG17_16950 [Cyanobacteria bacterium UBA11149]|nr:hypothetical protein [Cyanobacteria bacterium UBA11367]HBE57201.1 hypothetical protein [Cyanobacteria bacterium UBA11366]HBR75365.1 hypothetical protein [Cyanobacteria bacterium UBA11159]HBS72283.1 hypothetical protein [Cyanobacteria bacterium UBA11153]HBW90511.1 hypothetical protein [Cyanobacteria bacterium UBA11149]HCA93902.1 hypothetical protein [Cyanobacteria bacterium UBA9226]